MSPLSRDDILAKTVSTLEPSPGIVIPVDTPAASSAVIYRAGSKAVNTTTTATDLLGGLITVGGGVLGATGSLHLSAFGDFLNNSGGTVNMPRLQVILGGTTIFDTGAGSNTIVDSASRQQWQLHCVIKNDGAANVQVAKIFGIFDVTAGLGAFANQAFTTGNGHMKYDGQLAVSLYAVNSGLAVATSAAQALALKVINGSASASCETKLFGAVAEVV